MMAVAWLYADAEQLARSGSGMHVIVMLSQERGDRTTLGGVEPSECVENSMVFSIFAVSLFFFLFAAFDQ